MKSNDVKKGIERAPHRALFKAIGYTDEEIKRPLIGIANAVNTAIPGHVHLDTLAQAVKAGIYMAGDTPVEFGTIGVCDGIAMNHTGMKYSLASRELIADSVETMVKAHWFDGLICIPNCDKIVPGMLMAAARNGWLEHMTDSIPKKLMRLEPFVWYRVNLVYTIERGRYSLTVREEGLAKFRKQVRLLGLGIR